MRHFLRHPSDMPVELVLRKQAFVPKQRLNNISLGGVACNSNRGGGAGVDQPACRRIFPRQPELVESSTRRGLSRKAHCRARPIRAKVQLPRCAHIAVLRHTGIAGGRHP